MPNRIIKESARSSKTLDRLSDGAERLFWRLTTAADDFGRFEADPEILLATCFPRRADRLSREQISAWYGELEAAELVRTYAADDRSLGYFVKWAKHQTTRAKESKYPTPPPVNSASPTSASRREQMSPYSGSGSGSDSGSYSNTKADSGSGSTRAREPDPAPAKAPPAAPPAAAKSDPPDPPPSRKRFGATRDPKPEPGGAELSAEQRAVVTRCLGEIFARFPEDMTSIGSLVQGYLARGGPWPPLERALTHAAEHATENAWGYLNRVLRVEEPNQRARESEARGGGFAPVAGSSTLQDLIAAANRAANVGGASVHTEGE